MSDGKRKAISFGSFTRRLAISALTVVATSCATLSGVEGAAVKTAGRSSALLAWIDFETRNVRPRFDQANSRMNSLLKETICFLER